MGYNQDLIAKWEPILTATNCQEELRLTLATCCETMQMEINGIRKYHDSHKENMDFLEKYSIPILSKILNNSISVI